MMPEVFKSFEPEVLLAWKDLLVFGLFSNYGLSVRITPKGVMTLSYFIIDEHPWATCIQING